jgi:tRNA uridine 5-carbamoylmethylation protein Kti12
MKSKPTIVLLCGLPGSGKTTHADDLAKSGYTKLSIDEAMIDNYGVLGKDYPLEKYNEFKKNVIQNLIDKLVICIAENKCVVLDFGVWKKKDRIFFKNIVEKHGGTFKLLYFKVNKNTLIKRLEHRYKQEKNTAIPVSVKELENAIAKFEEPENEGGDAITQST